MYGEKVCTHAATTYFWVNVSTLLGIWNPRKASPTLSVHLMGVFYINPIDEHYSNYDQAGAEDLSGMTLDAQAWENITASASAAMWSHWRTSSSPSRKHVFDSAVSVHHTTT